MKNHLAVLGLAALITAACSEPGPAPGPAPDATDTSAAMGQELTPRFEAKGPFGAAPETVKIRFPRDVFPWQWRGDATPEGSVLAVEPALPGLLRVSDSDALEFVPKDGFRPGTTYRFDLRAVVTEAGPATPPEDGAWTYEMSVPEFAFVRFMPAGKAPDKTTARVAVVFSGPVDAKDAASHIFLSVLDPETGVRRQPGDFNWNAGDEKHVVYLDVPRRGLTAGSVLELELQAGAESAVDDAVRAAAASATITFSAQPEVRIVETLRSEADNGFYLRVLCDDKAGGQHFGFWDNDLSEYLELSQRCLPDEASAREKIRFEPAVDFSVAAGRGGFRIFADFARGNYTVHVGKGLLTVDGGELNADFNATFNVPPRRPSLAFTSKGRYLPRRAAQRLPLRHVNVDRAVLSIRHVPPENLVFWMSDGNENAGERESNLIYQSALALRGEADEETTSHIDIGSMVPADVQGLLEVRVSYGTAADTVRVLATDLQLIAKRTASGPVEVWVLDMHTLKPRRDVDVELVRKSGLALGFCRTDGQGACTLLPKSEGPDTSPPFALVARNGKDLTYLRFADVKAEVQEERIAGESYGSRGGRPYRAAVYSERGVYRPGETAHLAAIIRDNDNAAPAGMPVQARLVDPRGKTLRTHNLRTNDAGFVTLDASFADFANTGRYQVVLEAAEKPIGSHTFQVEEFVPERMKVEVRADADSFFLGDEKAVRVGARYLFGGVPADHRLELSCELAPGRFSPSENAQYHYGVWRPKDQPARSIQLGTADGKLDTDGVARLLCPAGETVGFAGPADLLAQAAVFEAGSGRTSVGRAVVPVHPEKFYVGLQSGAAKVTAGDDLVVEGVVVGLDGKTINDVPTVEMELVRLEVEWAWYFDEDNGYWNSRHQLRPVTEERAQVDVTDGRFKMTFRPSSDAPGFLVRARAGNARTDLELEGRGQWYYRRPGEGDDTTPAPGRATWIALETPDVANVGDDFTVRFEAPFSGRVLFTAETDTVLKSEWKDAEAGREVSWRFKPRELVPNVYVTAFLVKDPYPDGLPRGGDAGTAFMPERAFGVRSVTIEPVELTHPLTLDVPEEVRSNSRLTVALDLGKVEKGTFATVAAVDEGILSLTGFESPDPFRSIFAPRGLGVETFETVGWTLLVPPSLSTVAGDAGGGKLGRVQIVKPVALWAGLLEVPENGKLDVQLDVPQYRGALRVMAVTAGPKKMGRAAATVTVRDPVVVQATLPRFLTQGDDVRVPVQITNVSGKRRDVDIEIQVAELPVGGFANAGLDAAAPVNVLGNATTTLTLDDGAGDTAVFRLRARAPAGAAKVTVTVRSEDVVVEDSLDVPLLPAGPKSRRVEKLTLDAGELDLAPRLAGWMPLSERSTFRLTTQPYADAFEHLSYLVRYPHGCIEQTTSTAWPLLALGKMLPSIDPELAAKTSVEDMVQRGVDRIFSMQTPSGGFGYWVGATEPSFWSTAYATHFLLEARDAQYAVPENSLNSALDWIERQITHTYEAGVDLTDWKIGAEPYMHYVLAKADRGRTARIERLIRELGRPSTGEDQEKLFMLQAALYMAGDHRYEGQLKKADLSPVSGSRSGDWTFYSDRRRRGFMLATFVDLFGSDPAGEPLANMVAESLRGRSRGYTTQELVWSVTGLGKYAGDGAAEVPSATLRADGREVPSKKVGNDTSWSLARASEYGGLTLDLPQKGDGNVYLVVSSEGVREDGEDAQAGGEGLILKRRYRSYDGKEVDFDAGHTLGDMVYVELALTNKTAEKISNLALVDRVPAGWEIENPRLGRGNRPNWVADDEQWEPDYLEVRDDRLEVFGGLGRGETRQVVYAVRAVTAGRFTIPTAEAEAMYDPRIWAREAGREIFVDGPWMTSAPKAKAKEGP